jgi:hypothetical protein
MPAPGLWHGWNNAVETDPPKASQPAANLGHSAVFSRAYHLTPGVPTQLDDDPLASERSWREMNAKLPIKDGGEGGIRTPGTIRPPFFPFLPSK